MKFKSRAVKTVLFTMLGLFFVSHASATPVPGIEWSGTEDAWNDGPWLVGYKFSTDKAITVTSLGAYDQGGDGFAVDHTIGIWNAQDPITLSFPQATATLSAGSSGTLNGHFRYDTEFSALNLGPGTYIVAASNFGIEDAYAGINLTNLVPGPHITYLSDEFASGSSFDIHAPTTYGECGTAGGYTGYWGANFTYEVPEPSTALLTALGLLGLLGLRRRA